MRQKLRVPSTVAAFACAALIASAQEAGPPELPRFDRRSPVVLAVENVGPAVLSIRTQRDVTNLPYSSSQMRNVFQRPEEIDGHLYAEQSLGSGVIIHPYGYAVTNYHVLWGAPDRITAMLPAPTRGGTSRTVEAVLVNADPDNDLAILKIKSPGPFPYALLGDSDRLFVGETTIALGNPFGLSSSATTGIVSALNRSVNVRGEVMFKDLVQTSALINPGNSGGPLLDINGYVIGINVAIDQRGPGIGYAIPVNRVREVAANVLDPEVVKHAWLGIDVTAEAGGLRVERVADNSPAARKGVAKGDVILAVNGKRVDNRLGFNIELLEYETGATVPISLRRDREYVAMVPFEAVPPEELPAAGRRFESVGLVVADITPVLAQNFGIDPRAKGVVITKVEPGSIADQIQLAAGDVVVRLGDYSVTDIRTLTRVMATYARRAAAPRILVWRGDKRLSGPMPLR